MGRFGDQNTLLASQAIVKTPGAPRPSTPKLYSFDEDGSYGLDATPYPYGDDDVSYMSLEATRSPPRSASETFLPRRGGTSRFVQRSGALPLGAITVDIRKGGRAVKRVVPARAAILNAFRAPPAVTNSFARMSLEDPRGESASFASADRSADRSLARASPPRRSLIDVVIPPTVSEVERRRSVDSATFVRDTRPLPARSSMRVEVAAVRTSVDPDAPGWPQGGPGGGKATPEEVSALRQAGAPPDRPGGGPGAAPPARVGAKAAIGRREHKCNPALLIHCGGTRLPAPELLGDGQTWSQTPRVEPSLVGLPAYEGWPRPGPTPAWCLSLFALSYLHGKDAVDLHKLVGPPTAADARSLGCRDLEPVVQALRRLQQDGHLPTDPSTRLHFSCDELQEYLASEDGQGRAARTRPQWATLLETPTLLVVALRRGRRVAKLGPWSPDWLSDELVYGSLLDLRSQRLAELAAHLERAEHELDPALRNRAQRRRTFYNEGMRLKDATQVSCMVHAQHARAREAARRANAANRSFDERRHEESRTQHADAVRRRRQLENLLTRTDEKNMATIGRQLAEATLRIDQCAANAAFARAKADASAKRYRAPAPVGPLDKLPVELDPQMHHLVAVDEPYSYHGDMVDARSSTQSAYREPDVSVFRNRDGTWHEAGALRSSASIGHELSTAEHVLHSLQAPAPALPRPGGPEPRDDAGTYTVPYTGPLAVEDWSWMNEDAPPKSQTGPRHALQRMPPHAHGSLDAPEQRTYFAPRQHLKVLAGYWPGLGTPHKSLT